MFSKRASLRRVVLGGVAIGAFGFGGAAAYAQTPPATPTTAEAIPAAREAAAESKETIVVTGSLIRRDATNAPAPVIMVTQEELLRSGEPNIIDFLADIPALSGSTVPEDTTGSGLNDGGLSLPNLRDLGAGRTLTLIDGRRHVGAPQGALSVDIDTIPSLLIESVEIVTGGQSALYGADAVSGVLNFIMKKDFDGIQVDGSLAEINQEGQLGTRISGLFGKNLFDDRLNIYASADWVKTDEVTDNDIDYRREGYTLLNNDSDTLAVADDGQLDNILIRNARDMRFIRGGTVLLSRVARPTSLTDPDITPATGCTTAANSYRNAFNAACFPFGVEIGNAYTFTAPGVFRAVDFGRYQDQNGNSRVINIGGDGLNVGTEFNQASRLPESESQRYQVGFNFDITDFLTAYGNAKYVTEMTYDNAQPTFFQGGISNALAPSLTTPNNNAALIASTSSFNVGLDNAYIPAALRSLILANQRTVYDANGNVVPQNGSPTVPDSRANFNIFGPDREQLNHRDLQRFVVGFKGDIAQLGFMSDIGWDVGYTFGKADNKNNERAVDVLRFAMSADAVIDTAGVLGTPGAAVCRATLLTRQGFRIPDQNPLSPAALLSPTDPVITQCKPTNIFGVDLRDASTNPEARAYWDASINVSHTNIQQDFMATATGTFPDIWGAGGIGLAVGYETRKEKAVGLGRSASTAGRFLFLNTGADFPLSKYNTEEYFGEVRIPLLTDVFLAKNLELSAAYRKSDYSTVGDQEVKNFTAQYAPSSDIAFRASYGTSIRVPTLSENFAGATQTFVSITDPCDFNNLRTFTQNDPTRGANRRANCQTLLGANYNPDSTIITYLSTVGGVNSGNPFLKPEQSRSYTMSMILTPSFLPKTSFVVDYYDIVIDDVIAAVSAATAVNQCVNDSVINTNACNTFTRNGFIGANDPANFRVNSFIQGSINYASTLNKGIDFTAATSFDLQEMTGRNIGELGFSIRGNYLIRQQDFVNIASPWEASNFDSTVGLPRLRFLFSTTYEPTDYLQFNWDIDWQSKQEILDEDVAVSNPDTREAKFFNTTPFIQHDLTMTVKVQDNFNIRAGVVNLFDQDPDSWLGSATTSDNFDLFGRRFFVGFNYKF